MSSAAARQFVSFEDYLALEDASTVKHEYVGGVLYAMTGARTSHNRMVTRVVEALLPAGRAAGCDVFIADEKLKVGDLVSYYPDVMVCCDPSDDDEQFRTSPCLVVEVLSPGTAAVDRREKLNTYLALPSLLTYLMIDPEEPMIEAHIRATPTTAWAHETYGLDGHILLPCPVVALTVLDLYPS